MPSAVNESILCLTVLDLQWAREVSQHCGFRQEFGRIQNIGEQEKTS